MIGYSEPRGPGNAEKDRELVAGDRARTTACTALPSPTESAADIGRRGQPLGREQAACVVHVVSAGGEPPERETRTAGAPE